VETHTKVGLLGVAVFALPIPGTFVLGALILAASAPLYLLAD